MADLNPFAVTIEWIDAPGVTTPELTATWARYQVWVSGQCATQVEATDSTTRSSVYGPTYPLAEWIVANWYSLNHEYRQASVPREYWRWSYVREQEWLLRHNMRAAGNGFAWPDLSIVPEGAATCVRWNADEARQLLPVRFMSPGMRFIDSADIRTGLARVVVDTLDRLADAGLPETRLAADWAELGRVEEDRDELDFCVAAARLGLDPFDVDEAIAGMVVASADSVPGDLREEFFDSADPGRLGDAAAWVTLAVDMANNAAENAAESLVELRALDLGSVVGSSRPPWAAGFAAAARVRKYLGTRPSDRFDVGPWSGVQRSDARSAGVPALAVVKSDRCGLVLGDRQETATRRVFVQARTLGRALLEPSRRAFLLSSAHHAQEQAARAFAAELLAPAAGIRERLNEIGRIDEQAFEEAAEHFGVSPMVIRHQYDNQLERAA